jgi:hypothetical protein
MEEKPLSKTSGAAMRRSRGARGLPRLTPKEMAASLNRLVRRRPRLDARRDNKRRPLLDKIKIERGCADCGYNAYACALDFDHLPGQVKNFTLSIAVYWRKPLSDIEAEIEKCEVVCANCHRVRTANRIKDAKAARAAALGA